MNRRHFLGGTAFATLAGLPPGAARGAQEADVAAASLLDFSALDGFVGSAVREFYLAAASLADFVAVDPLAVIVATVEWVNDEAASASVDALRALVPETLEAVMGIASTGTRRSSVGSLGDDNLGLNETYEYPPDAANELSIGIAIVQKQTQVQAVIVATYLDGLAAATALAETLDARWPDADLLATLPTADDLPERLMLRVEAVAP